MQKSYGRSLLWIYLAAVAVKLFLIGVFFWPEGCLEGRINDYDDFGYYQIAKNFVENGIFAYPTHPEIPSVFRLPVYPFFLAGVGILTAWNCVAMQIVQAFVMGLAPVLLFLVLRRLKTPEWPAWLLVVDPLTNILSISFMTEGLLVLFLLGAFYFFLRSKEHSLFVFGALLFWVLSILIKPTVQYFYLVLILFLLVCNVSWRKVFLLALIASMPLFAWMVRNHHVSGVFCVSTQSDNMIVSKFTVMGKGDKAKITKVMHEYQQERGENIIKLITDNKFDFKDETKEFIKSNFVEFMKYHLLGMPRVLLGTGRVHVETVFFKHQKQPGGLYNMYMVSWYVLLCSLVLFFFRVACLRDVNWWFSFLFCAYNVGLIGIFSYMTGGGLKRVPFIPFILIMIGIQLREIFNDRKRHMGGYNGNA